MNPIAQILLKHFPMALDYLDAEDADDPYEVAHAIAQWFSQAPNAPDRQMRERMERFYSDPSVSISFGEERPSDAASVMQVGFFERLWDLPNPEITIPQVATLDYLRENKNYLCQWIGRDTYQSVMNKIECA